MLKEIEPEIKIALDKIKNLKIRALSELLVLIFLLGVGLWVEYYLAVILAIIGILIVLTKYILEILKIDNKVIPSKRFDLIIWTYAAICMVVIIWAIEKYY